MEDKTKEISQEEMEQASGGAIRRLGCAHKIRTATENSKVENGETYRQFRCNLCHELFWVKLPNPAARAIRFK